MPSVASISQQIWDMKYRLKGPDGAALDKTIEDTWQRVATALAAPEADAVRDDWAARFYGALEGFRFLPAGRVVAGAGSGRSVTLFNCFVMGAIPDDMSGIFTHLREAALTMQQGGGIGYDFSTLRPKGAPVKGVGADASGPLSFMDVWDAMCRTIMSAGYRRGAMMGTLSCDHPDIEAFIDAKREPGRLRMFNLSVLVTDAFMAAVKEGAPWELKFNGTTYKVLPARELWDRIMRATYAYAEPGVIFIDRINRRNNLHYCEEIHATNPCVTGETWVQTSEGPRLVAQLLGRKFTAVVDGQPHASGRRGFFPTGTKSVYRLMTREGYTLRLTGDHQVLTAASRVRSTIRREWRRADSLSPGDLVVLNNHGRSATWPGLHDGQRGTSIGYLVGRRFAALYGGEQVAEPAQQRVTGATSAMLLPLPLAGVGRGEGISPPAPAAAGSASSDPHPALSRKRERVHSSPSDDRADTAAARLGFDMASGDISPALEATSSAFYCGFLAGIFDATARVDKRDGRARIVLIKGGIPTLRPLQRMLLRLGILSEIEHRTLVIAGAGAHRFAGSVLAGAMAAAADTTKRIHLFAALAGLYSGSERFVAEVASVEPDGEAPVYDAQIPGINAFDANGIYAHNCGEQPLPPYGACLLGSINLASLVLDPFEPTARLDLAELARLVPLAVRMMDNVVDVSRFPLEQQTHEARAKRRIGLGVTGLADALILCGVRYGSAPAVALTEAWMKAIRREAYLASAALAAEKGAFPLFDRDAYLAGESVQELDNDVRAAIAKHGIRNALLTSIAPTGTISIFADNVSSGLEPVFSFRYTRNVLMPDGSRKEEEVADYALRLHQRLKGEDAALPDSFVDAQSLAPGDHLVMQAAVQKYIDSSISKTINLPADIAFDSFKDIYLQAYALGCKGCTTYRPNEVTGAVLEVRKEAERPSEAPGAAALPAPREPELPLPSPMPRHADIYEAGGVVYMTQPLSRPESLPGQTYKIKWPDGDHAIYITVNDVIQDGRRRPFEIFINSKNMEHYAWTVGLTRMISAVFRRGGDVSFVVEELKAVFDPRGGAWMGGKYVPSLLAAIGDVIERHMIDIGFIAPRGTTGKAEAARQVVNLQGGGGGARMTQCPKCGEASLIRVEGCDQCTSCGYSKCG